MSKKLSSWLNSHRSDEVNKQKEKSEVFRKEAKTISIVSGKGGVGKTFSSLLLSRSLGTMGYKVLLIDCDYNLSNTAVRLNLPLNDNFFSLLSMEKDFDECLYKEDNFHLLSGCNGNSDLFDNSFEYDRFILDVMNTEGRNYDYILLDCPAGINRETINIAAYSNYRFIIVNPDKASITDSYSLIKILKQKYLIKENHLLLNKVSNEKQYHRVIKSLMDTVSTFLGGNIKILGKIDLVNIPSDKFDIFFNKGENTSTQKDFFNIMQSFVEELKRTHNVETNFKINNEQKHYLTK